MRSLSWEILWWCELNHSRYKKRGGSLGNSYKHFYFYFFQDIGSFDSSLEYYYRLSLKWKSPQVIANHYMSFHWQICCWVYLYKISCSPHMLSHNLIDIICFLSGTSLRRFLEMNCACVYGEEGIAWHEDLFAGSQETWPVALSLAMYLASFYK